MKSKLSRILGVGLTVALLASLMVAAAPASAAELLWYTETSVENLKTKVNNILGPTGINIISLAVNDDTIYAATGATSSNTSYKSTNSGTSWGSLYIPSVASKKAINLVAVAADDANVLVAVSDDNSVYYSANGGTSWTALGIPASGATINAIDVSKGAARYVAAAGTNGVSAELYTYYIAMVQAWAPRVSEANGFRVNQAAILAAKFSPNFATDKIITVVSADNGSGTTGDTYFQMFRAEAGLTKWNGQIGAYLSAESATGWGTGIKIAELASENATAASIVLPPSYLGSSEADRVIFASAAGATKGNLARLSDFSRVNFGTWAGGAPGPLGSLAYHDGKLIAGDYDAAQVYVALNPMAAGPRFERLNTFKQPGGENMTVVACAGAKVVATASGDESAFAVSTDDGKSFNDISLIDTAISFIDDFAVSSDGATVYLTTRDTTSGGRADVSVWINTPAYTRVFSKRDVLEANAPFLVRMAPESTAAVYISSKDTTNLWVSKDSGKASWKLVPAYKLDKIQDFAIESADVVYAIDTTGLSKTSSGGLSWGSRVTMIDEFTPYMVYLAANKDVLIGGSNGYVAFSKDGGLTTTRTTVVSAGANVQVVADKAYATNNTIYAAAGSTVKRGKADATSSFASRGPTFDSGHTAKGIAESGGIVYVVSSNTSDSKLWRALNLLAGTSAADALWSSLATSYDFVATPQALVLAGTGPKLWAIHYGNSLTSATDPLATAVPTLTSPAAGAVIPVNPGTGQAYNITFTLKRPLSGVTKLELQIATDSAFGALLYSNTFDVTTTDTSKIIGPTGIAGQITDYMPGVTYYARVRVPADGPMYSPWSKTTAFSVTQAVSFSLVSPALGATNLPIEPTLVWTAFEGAIGYEIAVSTLPTFAILEYSHNVAKDTTFYKSETLAYGTTYYWRVRGVTGPLPKKGAAPGGPWISGVFTTVPAPVEVKPTIIVQEKPAPPAEVKVVEVPVQTIVPQPIPSYLLWIIIVIGAVLVIALIVLIARTRRVA